MKFVVVVVLIAEAVFSSADPVKVRVGIANGTYDDHTYDGNTGVTESSKEKYVQIGDSGQDVTFMYGTPDGPNNQLILNHFLMLYMGTPDNDSKLLWNYKKLIRIESVSENKILRIFYEETNLVPYYITDGSFGYNKTQPNDIPVYICFYEPDIEISFDDRPAPTLWIDLKKKYSTLSNVKDQEMFGNIPIKELKNKPLLITPTNGQWVPAFKIREKVIETGSYVWSRIFPNKEVEKTEEFLAIKFGTASSQVYVRVVVESMLQFLFGVDIFGLGYIDEFQRNIYIKQEQAFVGWGKKTLEDNWIGYFERPGNAKFYIQYVAGDCAEPLKDPSEWQEIKIETPQSGVRTFPREAKVQVEIKDKTPIEEFQIPPAFLALYFTCKPPAN